MKKILIILSIIIVILSLNKTEKITIPKESIRFRVIANSNSEHDQNTKNELVKNLYQEIETINTYSKDIKTSREIINNNIHNFEKVVKNTIQNEIYKDNYDINYGENYFPEKEYKGVSYEEGNYESLVITLGDGLGDNFWCVLFPPLCLLEAEETDTNKIEYTSFIKEIIDTNIHITINATSLVRSHYAIIFIIKKEAFCTWLNGHMHLGCQFLIGKAIKILDIIV